MSRWWYLLALLVAFGGCGASLHFGLSSSASSVKEMKRVVVPGEAEVELEPGTYTAYHESRSVVEGERYVNHSLPTMRCTVWRGGEPVELRRENIAKTSYEFEAYAGSSKFELDVAEAGAYRVRCDYTESSSEKPAVLALGSRVGGGGIMVAALGAFGSVAAGFAFALFVFISRHRRHQG